MFILRRKCNIIIITNSEGAAMSLLAQSNEAVSLVEMLTRATNDQALKIVGAWRDLLPKLITK